MKKTNETVQSQNGNPPIYKNLVFRAGGVLGIAYVGAITTLEKKGIMEGIERVAGSSAGSITAVALSMGYSAAELKQIMEETKFSKFLDGWINPFRLLKKYGVYKGEFYLEWMKKIISEEILPDRRPKLGLSPMATFADFHAAGCKELYIMVTNLTLQTVEELSYRTTPHLPVAEACRASMAIPGFFPAWKFSTGYEENHIFVDGGVLDLFPISLFDYKKFQGEVGEEGEKAIENFETLGFYLADKTGTKSDSPLQFGSFFRWLRHLFETAMWMQQSMFIHNPLWENRTITINDHGISATNFKLKEEQEKKLVDSGQDDTKAWLEQRK